MFDSSTQILEILSLKMEVFAEILPQWRVRFTGKIDFRDVYVIVQHFPQTFPKTTVEYFGSWGILSIYLPMLLRLGAAVKLWTSNIELRPFRLHKHLPNCLKTETWRPSGPLVRSNQPQREPTLITLFIANHTVTIQHLVICHWHKAKIVKLSKFWKLRFEKAHRIGANQLTVPKRGGRIGLPEETLGIGLSGPEPIRPAHSCALRSYSSSSHKILFTFGTIYHGQTNV